MKVSLLINSLAGGGAEKVALTLLKELKAAGVTIDLLLIDREQFYDLPEGVNVTYLTKYEKLHNPFLKFWMVFVCAFRIKKHVKQHGIDVVQSHLIRANYINVLSQMFGSSHMTQIVNHMMVSFDKKRGFLGKANLWLYKKLYSRANSIVSISRVMKNDLDEFFGFDEQEAQKHVVIYNPHDLDHIREMTHAEPDAFDFDPDKKYIISVGRLVERKRVDLTIEALATLRETRPEVELIVLGSGEMMDSYQAKAAELNLTPFVHFLGHITNPFAYLSRADVFVLASTDEGLPNIIIESMICGTAVVSSDCKSGPRETLYPTSDISIYLKDQIEIGEYGILFPVLRADKLAEALTYMLDHPVEQDEFVRKGLNRAEDFRASRIAQIYLQSFGQEPQTVY